MHITPEGPCAEHDGGEREAAELEGHGVLRGNVAQSANRGPGIREGASSNVSSCYGADLPNTKGSHKMAASWIRACAHRSTVRPCAVLDVTGPANVGGPADGGKDRVVAPRRTRLVLAISSRMVPCRVESSIRAE